MEFCVDIHINILLHTINIDIPYPISLNQYQHRRLYIVICNSNGASDNVFDLFYFMHISIGASGSDHLAIMLIVNNGAYNLNFALSINPHIIADDR